MLLHKEQWKEDSKAATRYAKQFTYMYMYLTKTKDDVTSKRQANTNHGSDEK